MSLGNLQTDGQAASVTIQAGKPSSAVLFGGTKLIRNGETLVESNSSAAVSRRLS